MRPRLITAENSRLLRPVAICQPASMRPRLITAENATGPLTLVREQSASMRPRLITAENAVQQVRDFPPHACFNEAAAHHRGEPGRTRSGPPGPQTASMRPRLITAENWGGHIDVGA